MHVRPRGLHRSLHVQLWNRRPKVILVHSAILCIKSIQLQDRRGAEIPKFHAIVWVIAVPTLPVDLMPLSRQRKAMTQDKMRQRRSCQRMLPISSIPDVSSNTWRLQWGTTHKYCISGAVSCIYGLNCLSSILIQQSRRKRGRGPSLQWKSWSDRMCLPPPPKKRRKIRMLYGFCLHTNTDMTDFHSPQLPTPLPLGLDVYNETIRMHEIHSFKLTSLIG